ncbi:hypothetical protein ABIB86_000458 [Bradyrhizobium sp. JR1.7]|uniref:hypothetical protein n=1 Tax=unclassified Bradyrhizobium TaxID=2631580 RepID=UPI003399C9CE
MAVGKQNFALYTLKAKLDYLANRCKPGRADNDKHIAELRAAINILEHKDQPNVG